MVRIATIALIAFATSAVAAPAQPGLESRNLDAEDGYDAEPEVGGGPALLTREEPPPAEPPVQEPSPEDVKIANQELAESFQKLLEYLDNLTKDMKEGKVQPKTDVKLSPEELKIANDNLLKWTLQSAQNLVEIAKPLVDGEVEQPAPGAE